MSTTSTTNFDPLSSVDAEVIGAWRSAEDAFFVAESEPDGYASPQLQAAFVDPELEALRRNLALQSFNGYVGAGPWDLGDPTVASLGPTEAAPTMATVQSCIHDTQLLVDRSTGVPVPGVLGTPDWAEATSQMVLTSDGTWKMASQSVVIEPDKEAVCGSGYR